jgi:hypothetical protein
MNKLMIVPIALILFLALYLIGKANYMILQSGMTTPTDYLVVGLTLLITATTINSAKNDK